MADSPEHRLLAALAGRRPGHSLPAALYTDPFLFDAEMSTLWLRRWVFAGHECELARPGDYITVRIGPASLIVLRGDDGALRALHNVCRHRGSMLCEQPAGTLRRRITCPYHQWSYALDGSLVRARAMSDDFDPSEHGLAVGGCETVGGLVYVCADAQAAPDFGPYRRAVGPYLAPFDLANAQVAHTSTIIEQGNWKLVMENNRECYHCRSAHPELCASFPEAPLHSGGGGADDLRRQDEMVAHAESLGLSSRFRAADDHEYRVMRMPLLGGSTSMTSDGRPAVGRRFGTLPPADIAPDLGDVLLYHYPSTWNHLMADHALTFRMLPLGPTSTELRTTWLVPAGAVAGVDYDLSRLTEVWRATNAQDTALVERAQRGVASPAYRPGPYAPVEEEGVVQFIEWYAAAVNSD